MKRLGNILIMSLALMAMMIQCKKNVEIIPNGVENETEIILNVNDSKVDVNTVTGAVRFENGDVVYVASNGKYVGTLTHNGSHFAGSITGAIENHKLYFYFLGNVTPYEELVAGTTTSCSVIISNQAENRPVISYGQSNEDYSSSLGFYTAHFRNQCALVKFNVNTLSTAPTCVVGFNNKMTVDFSGTFTPSKVGEGVINLGTGSGEKWAILLEQDALSSGEAFSTDGGYVGTCDEVPAISKNAFLKEGIDVDVSHDNNGKLRGKFSVSSSKQVYFSKGNLQYIGSAATPYWKFAEEQYERLGDNGQGSANIDVDRDLFGRGTSGYNGMHPYLTYDNNSYYCDKDFEGVNINYDWGVYNAIRNGGNTAGLWRTPKGEEFDYLFKDRSGYRFTQVYIDDVFGLMLFPDGWNASIYSFAEVNNLNTRLSTPITSAEWKNQLEPNGAVFLPAAYWRRGTEIRNNINVGDYWSSTGVVNSNGNFMALRLYFYENNWIWPYDQTSYYYSGFSVRLVTDVK